MKKIVSIISALLLAAFIYAENPIIQNIQVFPGTNSKINIMWSLPENPDEAITKVLIYRDTQPIRTSQQIQKMSPIFQQIPEINNYTDTVPDIQNYFYAVIAVTTEPFIFVLPSINASTTGVQTLLKKETPTATVKPDVNKMYPEGNLRETPLPFIDFARGENKVSPISEIALNAARSLSASVQDKPKKILAPYIFEQDLIEPDGSEDYLLFEVLKNYFVQRKYPQATVEFQRLIGTNIGDETRSRATFYLGQSLYFQKNYNDAIRTFVRIETVYPSLVYKWIDSSLDFIE